MDYCPIHSQYGQMQQQQTQLLPQHIMQINKQKNKKKAYKESLNQLRQEMRNLLDKQLQQEHQLNQIRTQYNLEKEEWQQEKKILSAMVPKNKCNNLQGEQKNYKEKKKQLKEQLKQYQQQQEFQDGQLQQILLENSKLKALINGRDQECITLQQEVEYYQRKLIQIQRQ